MSKNINYRLSHLLSMRGHGHTQALVSALKTNPDARMLVHSYAFKRNLIRQENLREDQVITVDELVKATMGKRNPILVDIPAILQLVSEELVLGESVDSGAGVSSPANA